MQITLTLTEEQLDKMIEGCKDKPELHGVYWQLQGYAFGGGGELNPTNIVASTGN